MKILITGAGGQLGSELVRRRWPPDHEIIAVDQPRLDIANRDAVFGAIAAERPDFVINAAAYTAVDRAESEPEAAWAVNRDAPTYLAAACRDAGSKLIHVSTDYVFDGGQAEPYREDDPVDPLGVYGQSKEAGERAIRETLAEHVIVRTAWLYSAHGHNFVKAMLRLASERPSVRVVADQRGSPTSAADLAAALAAIVGRIAVGEARWGTFHFTNAGAVSWHGFAEAIFALAAPWRGLPPKVAAITTADYPTPARRPANSVLDCARIAGAYGVVARPWRQALADVIAELFAAAPRR